MTRYNKGDRVVYKKRRTYVIDVLAQGKPILYVLSIANRNGDNITVPASKLKKCKKNKIKQRHGERMITLRGAY